MTEPMTRVLHDLCTEIDEVRAEMKREIEWRDGSLASEKRRHSETTASWTRDKDRLRQVTEHRDKLATIVQQHEAVQPRHSANLREYDRLTLDLYHYIVELAGHRDTAKTKAERVALGHVVQRLADIRGMDDAEREAVA